MGRALALLPVLLLLGAARAGPPEGALYLLQNLDVDAAADSPFSYVILDYSRDAKDAGMLAPAEVGRIRDGGRRTVLAYLSIGEASRFREYWQENWEPGSPSFIGPRNPVWTQSHKVRYWDPAWQALLFGSETAYLDRILSQGFDGVWLDIVDAYEFWGPKDRNERPTARADMVALVRSIAEYARARRPGFLVVPQNGLEMVEAEPEWLGLIDGVGAEDTWWWRNRKADRFHVDDHTRRMDLVVAAGKPVIAVDYVTKKKKIDQFFARCQARGYVPVRAKRDLGSVILDPKHVPGVGPTVTAVSPADDAALGEEPPTFTFDGDGTGWKVTFAGDAGFRTTKTFPGGKRWLKTPEYTPKSRHWRRIRRLADKAGTGTVWWWVTARDAEGRQTTTRARRLD